MAKKSIIVIGAGIVGVSTAIWLRRDGHDVTLLDKSAPGQAASFGNSGLLAGWAVAPVTSPTLWRDAPRMLLNPNGPLFLKWGHLPGMLPWISKFLSNTPDSKTQRIVESLSPLLTDTVDQHRSLVSGTGLEDWVHNSKISFVYRNLRAFQSDRYSWDMKAKAGLSPTVLTGPEIQDEEPMLGSKMGCIAQISGQGHITDPGTYVAKLANVFSDMGGRVVKTTVQGFDLDDDQIKQVYTTDGPFDCDIAVITSGIWSKDLAGQLGLTVPLQAERGYHVIYENPSQVPRNPMLMIDGKFGVNAMDMGLRFAGTVELGPAEDTPSKAPLRVIEHHVRRAFPNLTCKSKTDWMGFRPTLPDSTPMIGQIRQTGIYTGFGHQHVGLTAGPKTGRLLMQMIGGTVPNIDMAPFAPDRFNTK